MVMVILAESWITMRLGRVWRSAQWSSIHHLLRVCALWWIRPPVLMASTPVIASRTPPTSKRLPADEEATFCDP
jgi:hypothetical protein